MSKVDFQSQHIRLENEGDSSSEKLINEPMGTQKKGIKLLLSCFGLVAYAVGFHYAFYEIVRTGAEIRIWEDLYGRGLFFFFCSTASYMYYSR